MLFADGGGEKNQIRFTIRTVHVWGIEHLLKEETREAEEGYKNIAGKEGGSHIGRSCPMSLSLAHFLGGVFCLFFFSHLVLLFGLFGLFFQRGVFFWFVFTSSIFFCSHDNFGRL